MTDDSDGYREYDWQKALPTTAKSSNTERIYLCFSSVLAHTSFVWELTCQRDFGLTHACRICRLTIHDS